ncbi:hypothetical protein KEJ27_03310 [Candidatus Bathyarchaeota archaeon]|nr:hypothetical protein [Candidatus Bathyarchaeota archaeon]MBS7617496.1 hypothetical protein [Candidatus Bathyarchaeota archaeon]
MEFEPATTWKKSRGKLNLEDGFKYGGWMDLKVDYNAEEDIYLLKDI